MDFKFDLSTSSSTCENAQASACMFPPLVYTLYSEWASYGWPENWLLRDSCFIVHQVWPLLLSQAEQCIVDYDCLLFSSGNYLNSWSLNREMLPLCVSVLGLALTQQTDNSGLAISTQDLRWQETGGLKSTTLAEDVTEFRMCRIHFNWS